MSEQPVTLRGVPQWDIADRMRKALREARITSRQMAAHLDVNEATISTWINGRVKPSTQTLRLWSLRCGVPFEWLRYGITPDIPPGQGQDNLTWKNIRHGRRNRSKVLTRHLAVAA